MLSVVQVLEQGIGGVDGLDFLENLAISPDGHRRSESRRRK